MKVSLEPCALGDGAWEALELKRCGNSGVKVCGSRHHSSRLSKVHEVSPLVTRLPDNKASPQRQVSGCQMHETEPCYESKPFHQHLTTSQEERNEFVATLTTII